MKPFQLSRKAQVSLKNGVKINPRDPLSQGLRYAIYPGYSLSAGEGKVARNVNGFIPTIDVEGRSADFFADNQEYLFFETGDANQLGSEFTFLCAYHTPLAPVSASFPILAKDEFFLGRAYAFDIHPNHGARIYVAGSDAPGDGLRENRAPQDGDRRIVVGTRSVNDNITEIYVDGVLSTSDVATTATPASTAQLWLAGKEVAVGFEEFFSGGIYCILIWARRLSALEIARITRDLTAPLKVRKIGLPFPSVLVPVLTDPTAINITPVAATPRVTITF